MKPGIRDQPIAAGSLAAEPACRCSAISAGTIIQTLMPTATMTNATPSLRGTRSTEPEAAASDLGDEAGDHDTRLTQASAAQPTG